MSDPRFELEKAARESGESLFSELLELVRHNKKWWMVPLLVMLMLLAGLLVLGGTAAAPFIYTLF
jgi:hypothetical protein